MVEVCCPTNDMSQSVADEARLDARIKRADEAKAKFEKTGEVIYGPVVQSEMNGTSPGTTTYQADAHERYMQSRCWHIPHRIYIIISGYPTPTGRISTQ